MAFEATKNFKKKSAGGRFEATDRFDVDSAYVSGKLSKLQNDYSKLISDYEHTNTEMSKYVMGEKSFFDKLQAPGYKAVEENPYRERALKIKKELDLNKDFMDPESYLAYSRNLNYILDDNTSKDRISGFSEVFRERNESGISREDYRKQFEKSYESQEYLESVKRKYAIDDNTNANKIIGISEGINVPEKQTADKMSVDKEASREYNSEKGRIERNYGISLSYDDYEGNTVKLQKIMESLPAGREKQKILDFSKINPEEYDYAQYVNSPSSVKQKTNLYQTDRTGTVHDEEETDILKRDKAALRQIAAERITMDDWNAINEGNAYENIASDYKVSAIINDVMSKADFEEKSKISDEEKETLRFDPATVSVTDQAKNFFTGINYDDVTAGMSDDEIKVFNYLLNTGDRVWAEDFRSRLNKQSEFYEDIGSRKGREFYKKNLKGHPILTALYSVPAGFMGQFVSNMQNLDDFVLGTTPDPKERSELSAIESAKQDHGALYNVLLDLGVNIGDNAPSWIIGGAAGAAAKGFGAAVKTAQGIANTASAGTMFLSAGSAAYSQAIEEGYSAKQAQNYGVITGLSEAFLEKALGGIAGMGGKITGKSVEAAIKNIEKAGLRMLAEGTIDMAGEFTEEYLQEILDPVFRNITLDENNEFKPFTADALYAGMLGALSAATVNAGPLTVDAVSYASSKAKNAIDTAAAVKKVGSQITGTDAGSAALKLAENMGIDVTKASADVKEGNGLGKLREMAQRSSRNKAMGKTVQKVVQKELAEAKKVAMDVTQDEGLAEFAADIATGTSDDTAFNILNMMDESTAEKVLGAIYKIQERSQNKSVRALLADTEETYGKAYTSRDIAGIKKSGTNIKYMTSDGNEVTADEIGLSSREKVLFKNAVSDMSETDAGEMISEYRRHGEDISPDVFAYTWGYYRNLGKTGATKTSERVTQAIKEIYFSEDTVINDVLVTAALAQGVKLKAAEMTKSDIKARAQRIVAQRKGRAEGKVTGIDFVSKNKRGAKTVSKMLAKVGYDIAFVGEDFEVKGQKISESSVNGIYDGNTNTIYLRANAVYKATDVKGILGQTLAHEITHSIKAWNRQGYEQLTEYIRGVLGADMEQLVTDTMQKRGMGYTEALDEVIADGCEMLLRDSKALAKIAMENAPLYVRIREKIAEFVSRLRKAQQEMYEGTDVLHDSALALKQAIGENIEELQQTFDNVLYDSITNMRNALAEAENAKTRENLDVLEKQAEKEGLQLSEEEQNDGNTEKISEETKGKIKFDAKTDSVSPAFSEETWRESDYVQHRNEAAKALSAALGVSKAKALKYIDDVNSIAKTIADDRVRLDYRASSFGSAFVSNAEYGGSFDYTTLCKKRRIYTGTFSEIQKRLRNTALTADEILDLRNMLIAAGYEATCGLCYVEGSRAQMGKFAKEFINLYKRDNPNAWIPDMADVNTPDGVEQMRINHPEAYESYEYFWNHYGKLKDSDKALFASQQKPKLYESRKAYRNEIKKLFKSDSSIERKNLNGGIRMQSFSDFEIVHLIDTMQVIMDMSEVGLAGQAYTKVPEFARAFGNTGLKINLSLIAKGVDENGRLIFDDREGMPHDTAFELRDQYSENVGTILVTFTDEQAFAAMTDDRIDFIIPFHRSQWKKGQYNAMGLPKGTKDYTYVQNEKLIKKTYHEYRGRQVLDKATNYMPNEYWDFSKSGRENAEAYLDMCAKNNKRPKFYKFLDYDGNGRYSLKTDGSTDGYWKLLIDFKMYDNDGNGSPQKAVRPDFNMGESRKMLDEYTGGHQSYPVANDVVDKFVDKYKSEHEGMQFSEETEDTQNRKYQMRIADLGLSESEAMETENAKGRTLDVLERLFNGQNVPIEEINGLPLIKYALREMQRVPETYTDNSEQRQLLRSRISSELSALGSYSGVDSTGKDVYNGSVEKGHRIDFVIGLPAAGKSSVLANPLSSENHARIVDSDMAKERLPEFNNGLGANAVHRESQMIAEQFMTEAMKSGDNIVYPIVGARAESLIEKIKKAKSYGYSVYLHLNELPNSKAVGRALNRYLSTGRFLSPELVASYGETPVQSYETIKNTEGLIDGYSRYSNDVKWGEKPILREESAHLHSGRNGQNGNGNVLSSSGSSEKIQGTVGESEEIKASDVQFSEETETSRDTLVSDMEAVAETDEEKSFVEKLKSEVKKANALQKELAEVNRKIKEISFTKGTDRSALPSLNEKKERLAKKLNRLDSKFYGYRGYDTFKTLAERKSKEAVIAEKLRSKAALRSQAEKYRDAAAKAKAVLAERTENKRRADIARDIAKRIDKIDSIAKADSKTKHIPSALRQIVRDFRAAVDTRTQNYDERIAKVNEAVKKLEEKRSKYDVGSAEYEELSAQIEKKLALAETYGMRGEKAEKYLDGILEYYKTYGDGKSGTYLVTDELTSIIEGMKSTVGERPLYMLSADELEIVLNATKAVQKQIATANKLFKSSKSVSDTVNAAASQTNDRRNTKAVKNPAIRKMLSAATDFFYYNNLKPYELFKITGSQEMYNLYRRLQRSEGDSARLITKYADKYRETAKKNGVKEGMFGEDTRITLDSGKTIVITRGEALTLHLTQRREQGRTHLLGEGFKPKDGIVRTVENGKVKTRSSADFITLTETDLSKFGEAAGKNLTAFGEEMQNYMSTEMSKDGNGVSMALYDVKLFGEKNYISLDVDQSKRVMAIEKSTKPGRLENRGFTQKTVENATQGLLISSFDDVFASHATDMAAYAAFALPLNDMMRVINGKTADGVQLKALFGEKLSNSIQDFLNDVNGGIRSDNLAIPALFRSFKAAATGNNLRVAIQQPTAIMRSLSKLNPKYYEMFFSSNSRTRRTLSEQQKTKLLAEMGKYTSTWLVKELGGADINAKRSLGKEITYLGFRDTTAQGRLNTITEKQFWLAEKADQLTWMYIWSACKNEAIDKLKNRQKAHGIGYTYEDVLRMAGDRFDEVTNETQVYDSVFARSKIMRSSSYLAKLYTSFFAEPSTTLNMAYEMARKFSTGEVREAVKIGVSLIFNSLFNIAAAAVVDAMRDDDDDQNFKEKYIEALFSNLLDNFEPMGYMPYFRDLINALKGYDVNRSDVELVSRFVTKINKLRKEIEKEPRNDRELLESAADVSLAVVDMFGIAGTNFKRDFMAIVDTVTKKSNWEKGTKTTLNSSIKDALNGTFRWGKEKSYSDKLYYAVMNEDSSYIKRMKESNDEDEYKSLIKKGLKDHDLRVASAAACHMDGDFDGYERYVNDIVKDGFDREHVVSAILSAENKMLKDAAEEDEDVELVSQIDGMTATKKDIYAEVEKGEYGLLEEYYRLKVDYYKEKEDEEPEKKAVTAVKNLLTSNYKEIYEDSDEDAKKKLREMLTDIKVDGHRLYTYDSIRRWDDK